METLPIITLPEAVTLGQIIALIFFAANFILAVYIGWRWEKLRGWLFPICFYLADGVLFYFVAVPDLWTADARLIWSVVLRIHSQVTILGFMLVLLWALSHNLIDGNNPVDGDGE